MSCAGCVRASCDGCLNKNRGKNKGASSSASRRKLALKPSTVTYVYDGSLAGFFCCVYETVYGREMPFSIEAEHWAQPSLLPQRYIATDEAKARRVRASIPQKISGRALALVESVFLSCMPEKELPLLNFLLLGYEKGAKTIFMMGHPVVAQLLEAERHFMGECHLLRGFIRFSEYNGVLAATITPKNFVLPYIANHFINRFSGEDFMIYDKTHKAALIYQQKRKQIVPLEDITFPAASEAELHYRELWKRFYATVAIESRYNPGCRMTHMPKRYWENMTEMQDLL